MRIIDAVEIVGDEVILSYGGRALDLLPDDEGHRRDDEVLVDAVKARANLVGLGEIETEEYPPAEKLLRPTDEFAYHYVSDAYLTGLINYTSHVRTIGVLRYRRDGQEGDGTLDAAKAALERALGKPRFSYRDYGDDVVFIRESAAHYWAFLYDMDNSDCSIVRVRKGRGVGFILDMLDDGYLGAHEHWDAEGEPRGWIS